MPIDTLCDCDECTELRMKQARWLTSHGASALAHLLAAATLHTVPAADATLPVVQSLQPMALDTHPHPADPLAGPPETKP